MESKMKGEDGDNAAGLHPGVDPLFMAMHRLRQRRYEDCSDICTGLLRQNQYDQAVWYLKCRALTLSTYIDDTELEEEGAADLLMDENAMAQAPRPGTSLSRPSESSSGISASVRPVSSSGRPQTGFARPGTASGGGGTSVEGALKGLRPGTSRPTTAMGRYVRLGTASMAASSGGKFINIEALSMRKYASRPALAKVLCDYILYHEHNPRKALELAAEATVLADYKDWWWKARLGKCYYQLGLLSDAARQFKSSIMEQEMIMTYLEWCKVYLRMDQPNTALSVYERAHNKFNYGDTHILLSQARVHDMLNNTTDSMRLYKQVLLNDSANVEAIACLAAFHFYSDQPEVALRFYRRMVQMGVYSTELWNNLGLCCFYASQYDMTLSCFNRALQLADDTSMPDVWYNVGHICISIGDLGQAYQSFKIAISIDSNHAESHCNLGVLELRKGNIDQARSSFQTAQRIAPFMYEPYYNGALLAYKLGSFQEAYELANKSLKRHKDHSDTKELIKILKQHFDVL